MYHSFSSIDLKKDQSHKEVAGLYNQGYVFTRLKKGNMHQIRSCRVVLSRFALSSENRRVLKKHESLELRQTNLPLSNYTWEIAKMGSDFYKTKFGSGIMSANKIKEMCTDSESSNMNSILEYTKTGDHHPCGYCICYSSVSLLHYSYPFYNNLQQQNLGMAMMLKAVIYAKEKDYAYIYLGTEKKYKLQFSGVETFDGARWHQLRKYE